MLKTLFYSIVLLIAGQCICKAQTPIHDGYPDDSIIIRFTSDTMVNFVPDTAASPLWQSGKTNKAFWPFDTTYRETMMTDTLNPYPANANNWFIIKLQQRRNTIVDFWHKYSTDSTHAGGIVEFSVDTGHTWQNIKGDCNIDSGFGNTGVITNSFYAFNDTLLTGEPSFTGSGGGRTHYSRLQFFAGFFFKTTTAECTWPADTIYLRFRFISDTTTDTLAGWEIDSIKIEYDFYTSSVAGINNTASLNIIPNPSYDGHFTFPVLPDEEHTTIEIYNSVAQRVLVLPYTHTVSISDYPAGLYFYKVSNGTKYYSGQLLKE